MTKPLDGQQLAERIAETVQDSVEGYNATDVQVKLDCLLQVARFLKETLNLDFSFLNSITAVDYVDHIELVYHLTSIAHNHSAVIKSKVYDREKPTVPSVISLWQGADFQEREVWDLMGVAFDGHPNMKRIMLWEGFQGHPLRRDYLEPPHPAYTWPQGG